MREKDCYSSHPRRDRSKFSNPLSNLYFDIGLRHNHHNLDLLLIFAAPASASDVAPTLGISCRYPNCSYSLAFPPPCATFSSLGLAREDRVKLRQDTRLICEYVCENDCFFLALGFSFHAVGKLFSSLLRVMVRCLLRAQKLKAERPSCRVHSLNATEATMAWALWTLAKSSAEGSYTRRVGRKSCLVGGETF